MRKIAFLTVLLALATSIISASAQRILIPLSTFGTNNDGTIRPGDFDYTWLTSDGSRYQRGMAFNRTTGHLIIANRNPGVESINVIDALTGTNAGTLDLSSTTLGGASGFAFDQVGVADDGAIYVGNLTTSGTLVEFILYRWQSETSPQTLVYFGNPGNTTTGGSRWGDTLAVRGAGMSTEVLLGTQSGTLAAILRPSVSDLSAFTNAPLSAAVPSGGLGYGLAFAAGNTFYGKAASAAGNPLYLMSYDVNAGTATPLYTYGTGQFPGTAGPLRALTASNWLACIADMNSSSPHKLRLFDVSNLTNSPVLLDRVSVPTWTNANGVYAGAVAFGFGTNLYALDSDNGIAAFTIGKGTNPLPPYVFGQPQSQIVQLTSNVLFSVGADGTAPLSYQWQFNGTNIANATNSSFSIANASPQTNQGSYSVVVTNNYGSDTSAVAVLTVLASYGNKLVYEPFDYAEGSFLDGQGGWVLNSGAHMTIQATNLSVPNLAPSMGNHVMINGTGATRFPIGTYTLGALYFSFAMKLDDASSTTSETTAGFAVGTSSTYSPKINIAGDGTGKYTIGVYKNTGTTTGGVATNADGTPMLFSTGETVFIVSRYTFKPGSTSDTCDLWINPDPSTFGALTPPTPTFGPIGEGRANLTGMDRFALRDSSGYPGRHFDEIRVGFDWASVTPPANPQLDISLIGSNVKLLWPTNVSAGYILQSIRAWNDIDGWQPVTTPVVVEGGSNTVTVAATGTRFFRLKK